MRRLFDAYDDRVIIGEIYLSPEELMRYYGANMDEVHLPFNFQLILLPWDATIIGRAVSAYEALLPALGWPNWVLGNHDQHRIATRVGRAQARVAAMLLLTLRGTPTCYYGDELAMVDGEIPPELVRDPQELGKPGLGLGRDPERTPMQWDASPHGGFTTGTPWLPVAADYPAYNVAAERDDPASMLTFVRTLLALRRATPALSVGNYAEVPSGSADLFAFAREHDGQKLVVVLNFSHAPQVFQSTSGPASAQILLSTVPGRSGAVDLSSLALKADEGLILRL
jgi:alpha-glucosidase